MTRQPAAEWLDRFTPKPRWGYAFRTVPVRILTVSRGGVRCRFPDGHVERLHPDDVVLPSEPRA